MTMGVLMRERRAGITLTLQKGHGTVGHCRALMTSKSQELERVKSQLPG